MPSKLNFTIGPVMQEQSTLDTGARQIPYFRTDDFSQLLLENEKMLCALLSAPNNSRCVFFTASGTASMEAAVINLLTKNDIVLVVNGGSFGERLVELCQLHEIPFTEIKIEAGKTLTKEQLFSYSGKEYTALLMQHCETSTGVLYDVSLAADFCKRENIFFILDCISSFLAEPLDMKKNAIDAIIIGSQKALALPPGISSVILSQKAVEKACSINPKSLYLNIALYLKNGERGQTPFTPAVGLLIQLHERLKRIMQNGGAESEIHKIGQRARYFREKISNLPFSIFSETPSNSVTALQTKKDINAIQLFKLLEKKYNIYICPNGGALAQSVFRIGHIGNIELSDIDTLVNALESIIQNGDLQNDCT